MSLTLYNTLTRTKEPFVPLDRSRVRMYVCGPTVYDYAHIGNARPVIVFDVLFRLLRHIYGADHVTYARNITDVDDKINARAAEEGVSIRDLTERTASQFHSDIAALGVLPPTVEPRATEHIAEMRTLCEALVKRGHAYVADGHVLFDVASMPDYGRLANRSLEEMEAGARVDVAPYKKGPMDFVLWKPSKPAGSAGNPKQAEPSWPSPCGIGTEGRPGWHIECSAMSEKHLGTVFDIHGGGIDLVFPHHENEIAQSRCAHGTPVMARYWMHNGFLQVEGEKMSKSLGNFITINELLQDWPGEAVRLAMLSTHYRQPINWTLKSLGEAKRVLDQWATWCMNVAPAVQAEIFGRARQHPTPSQSVIDALCDDLNTPLAIAEIHKIAHSAASDLEAAKALLETAMWLGLLRPDKLWVFSTSAIAQRIHGKDHPIIEHELEIGRIRAAVANADYIAVEPRIFACRHTLAADGWAVEVGSDGFLTFSAATSPVAEPADLEAQIAELISARAAARKARNWAEADRLRDELTSMGITLKDSKNPATGEIETTWEIKR